MVSGDFSLPAVTINFLFMKILILTALYPPLGANGQDDRCRQVVDALSKRGHQLQVLTSNHRVPSMGFPGQKGVYRHLQLHDSEGIECRLGVSYAATYEQELIQARMLYNRLDHFQPDVVYVWNMQGVSKSLLFNLQNQDTPIAYDLHSNWLSPHLFELDPWFTWWQRNQSLRSKCYQFYLKLSGLARRRLRYFPVGTVTDLDISNGYVCSESLRADLVAAGVAQAATLPVIYPALNTEALLSKISYHPARKFMWAGRLNASKAPGIALRAVEILKGRGIYVSLDFYGMGMPSERKAMRNLIDRAGLSDSVRMLMIRPGELVSKYPEYDALLFTSCCNDPFPITPLEAMLSGLPSILARDGGIEEIAKDGEIALLYDAGDAEALADAMVRMMNIEDGGSAMAKKCMERLQVQHSLDTFVPQIEAFLSASIQS
jgi:glycosyltransferase involved in cell wall biosynthesis